MEIIPAIDLQNGEAVRLYKGDYDKKTVYSKNPLEIDQKFEQIGAKYLHLVDLDGAKLGQTRNLEIVRKIKDQTNLKIEIGGGIRNLDTVSLYLEQIGVERVILGTAAAEKPDFLKELLVKYGLSRIVVGVDIREGFVSTSGWLEKTTLPYLSFLKDLEKIGVKTVIVTDISKDGTLTGPNFELYDEISKETSLDVIVSGGVKDSSDIQRAADSDFYGIIVGKAYYEGKINLEKEFNHANKKNYPLS